MKFVTEEWQETAIYDITIKDSECKWPQRAAYSRYWAGVRSFRHRGRKKGEKTIHGKPGWTYYEFKDSSFICLTRLAKRFKDAIIVRDSNGMADCPLLMKPCTDAPITECVMPEKHDTDCPITDVKLVEAANFDQNKYPGYTIAANQVTNDPSWYLLYSRKENFTPLASFELTEEEPCVLSGAFKTSKDIDAQNIPNRTEDIYTRSCPDPLERMMEHSYRPTSNTVTVNEGQWLFDTGIIEKISDVALTPWYAWSEIKRKNELQLWQRPMEPWSIECDEQMSLSESLEDIERIREAKPFHEKYEYVDDARNTAFIVCIVKTILLFVCCPFACNLCTLAEY